MKKQFTLLLLTAIAFSFKSLAVPVLNSFPSASATIFLDFDGHYVQSTVWNGGTSFYCTPSGMTDPQITEAFNRVAEDFRPFNINITTDSTVFLAAPLNKRVRIIITTTSSWYPGVGGVSYVGSFTWGDDTPAFVFSDLLGPYSPKMVGECCSHESGHTLGLSHQSKYGSDCSTPIEQYNSGAGSGETGWSPIMGNSYYRNMSNWNNGPTPYGCNSVQDNLSIISSQNGFGYRPDDFAETLNASTYTIPVSNFSINGLIGTNADKDAFRFTLAQNTNLHLTAIPYNVSSNYIGANLDIRVELYNAAATLIRIYDPLTTMSVTIDTVLNAGTYYLKLNGTGNSNIGSYGSLGAYTLSGYSGALPIHDVSLSGSVDKNKHNLNWRIIADEPVKTILIETSDDGTDFNSLTTLASSALNFTYQPYKINTVYYRLKVVSVINQTVYSNTIALRGTGSADKPFSVSTLVQNELVINAASNYQYRLLDMNGRTISAGSGLKGISRVNVTGYPAGMYIIQLFSNDDTQTERIIKQ
ncbi:MAG: T9SS type A sorting domain-containing protein [Chitinophagaceae bacterium]|nr:T9SS type A sorting domain-containing protein [Chitinophagaceae bacterium]